MAPKTIKIQKESSQNSKAKGPKTASKQLVNIEPLASINATIQANQYARSLLEASLDPLVTISPEGKIINVNGNVLGVFAAARDVTARIKAEKEIAEQREFLSSFRSGGPQ